MARNVVSLRDNEDTEKPDQSVIQTITKKAFDALHKLVKGHRGRMDGERAEIGGLVSEAVTSKHLHKGAYGIFCRLDRMDALKRSELLFHFDVYRERANWNTMDDLFERHAEEAAE
jgi:hypothetical protein